MSEPEMCNPEKPKRKFWQFHLSTAGGVPMRFLLILAYFLSACCLAETDKPHVVREENSIRLNDENLLLIRIHPEDNKLLKHDFFLLETEVTNGAYAKHLTATVAKKDDLAFWNPKKEKNAKERESGHWTFSTTDPVIEVDDEKVLWKDNTFPDGTADFPVTFLTIREADQFCCWLTKKYPDLGTFRLPNVEEWRVAAYGNDSRKYPWGDDWNDDAVCASCTKDKENVRLESVKKREKGRTKDGLYGMFGNASEFVILPPKFPSSVSIINVGMIFMGGSYKETAFKPGQDYWGYCHNSNGRSQEIGFRVLLDPEDKKHEYSFSAPMDSMFQGSDKLKEEK
jgi:hypothetical protein